MPGAETAPRLSDMIEVQSLTKSFGDHRAVDDLSFEVRPGAVTGFLGPNGAGKSTTMRLILGLDRPTSGEARIDGRRYRDLCRPLTTVGALLDPGWVHERRSARSHLAWLVASNDLPRGRIDEVVDMVGLADVADRKVGDYSLGMAQRLGIAAALLGDPKYVLFDEPGNGLDPEGIVWIRRIIRRLAAQGRAVLVSSHLLSEMAQIADHLVVIARGRLVADTSVDDFVAATGSGSVRVRARQPAPLREELERLGATIELVDEPSRGVVLRVQGLSEEQVADHVAATGAVVYEISTERGSLEDAFMRLTDDALQFRGASGEETT